MKVLVTISLYFLTGQLAAQADSSIARQCMALLEGYWVKDSTNISVEFKIVHGELMLVQDNFYEMHFLQTDSFPTRGVSMTWPPHYCVVNKTGKKSIEIEYTLFGSKPVMSTYSRLKL